MFDLDGTLVDRLTAVRRIAGLLWDQEPAVQAVDNREEAIHQFLEFDGDGYTMPRSRVFELANERWHGMSMSVEQLTDWYRANYPLGFSPDPAIHKVLASLKHAGFPIGIVTNGPATQLTKIERLGLDRFTEVVVVSETFGHEKPDPAIFEHALQLVGAPTPSNVLYVGDNPVADISGARAMGMKTAWVRRGRQWPQELEPADYTISHVSEVVEIISL
ncbi:MAG: HAD family hydrolase [Dehalococcoidia bacterium]